MWSGRLLDTCDIPWNAGRISTGLDACLQTGQPVRIDDLRCDRACHAHGVGTDVDTAGGQRGEINQVILNLITNAAHAISEMHGNSPTAKGRIRIATRYQDGWAEIRIQDTGAGIPEAIRHQVFDLFFTTKEEGIGSGQGLAIAHSVIVEKHGGGLTFESAPGEGAPFFIRLPVKGRA